MMKYYRVKEDVILFTYNYKLQLRDWLGVGDGRVMVMVMVIGLRRSTWKVGEEDKDPRTIISLAHHTIGRPDNRPIGHIQWTRDRSSVKFKTAQPFPLAHFSQRHSELLS